MDHLTTDHPSNLSGRAAVQKYLELRRAITKADNSLNHPGVRISNAERERRFDVWCEAHADLDKYLNELGVFDG